MTLCAWTYPEPQTLVHFKVEAPRRIFHGTDNVLRRVARAFDLSLEDLKSGAKRWEVSHPRFAAFLILREDYGLSFPVIGRRVGGLDHTSVMHGVRRAKELLRTDPDFRAAYERARQG